MNASLQMDTHTEERRERKRKKAGKIAGNHIDKLRID